MTDLPASLNDIPTAQTRYLSCAETAKLVRVALKEAFPGQKFSVRSSTYANGASITVSWVDGPTTKEVDEVVAMYEGATFDGMIDLKSYKDPVSLNGEKVSFGSDYVITQRSHSDEFKAEVVAAIETATGKPFEPNKQLDDNFAVEWNGEWVTAFGRGCYGYGSDVLHRIFSMTSKYEKPS